jgi:hypothetical protein
MFNIGESCRMLELVSNSRGRWGRRGGGRGGVEDGRGGRGSEVENGQSSSNSVRYTLPTVGL